MYTLVDNCDSICYEVLRGSLMDCLEYVRHYEKEYCKDRGEKSLYLNRDNSLKKTDELIEQLVLDCEFTILETKSNLPINYTGIASELNNQEGVNE